ncbi:MAG: histidine phosphatase family protein [Candidatus Limivivens sp.]|nr:histidine phosphatase family protein [Candidatus Limivivens sp.]
MKILLIRHGDPDYVHDTLTAKGHIEAALLSEKMAKLQIRDFYVSPLGRAKDTASYTLKKVGKKAEELDWLREFPALVDINDSEELQRAYPDTKKEGERYRLRIAWDMAPGYWTEHPEYFSADGWRNSQVAAHSDMIRVYDRVIQSFDEFLASCGYVREGAHYRVEQEKEDTMALFCHFGVSCVLLSHLWSLSPFVLWHSLAMAPTSVTEVVTEEREKGCAYFRALRIGDISHLYAGGEEPSFACRFCETYGNPEQRH